MEPTAQHEPLIFLGTGASEAIPAAFCRCPCCQKARQHGGPDRRTRSALRIDGRHQIDFGPDSTLQLAHLGLDAFELEHLLLHTPPAGNAQVHCLRCRADIVILEATFGGDTGRGLHPDGHLDLGSALLALERMEAIALVGADTLFYATHINHKHELMHADLQAAFDRSRFAVTVAYDAMSIKGR